MRSAFEGMTWFSGIDSSSTNLLDWMMLWCLVGRRRVYDKERKESRSVGVEGRLLKGMEGS